MAPENIVVVVCDSLREKDVDEETAPFLTSMGGANNQEIEYYSNASWTVPAHASMFSGKLPSEHGAKTENPVFEDENKLVKKVSEHGYRTSLITENFLLTPELGFGEEFDEFIDMTSKGKVGKVWDEADDKNSEFGGRVEKWSWFLKNSIAEKDTESMSSLLKHVGDKLGSGEEDFNPTYTGRTIEQVLDRINSEQKEFVVANLMPVHYSCTFNDEQKQRFLPDDDREDIQELIDRGAYEDFVQDNPELDKDDLSIIKRSYRASIRYLDTKLEQLYRESSEDTVFIVLGDHGEVIGEHSIDGVPIYEHFFGTYRELLEVPFQIFPQELSIRGSASHIDLTEIIDSLIREKSSFNAGKEVIAEHYGRAGYNRYFNREVPTEFEKIFLRESFSVIEEGYKLDITTEGDYLWELDGGDKLVGDEARKSDLKSRIPFVLDTVLKEKNLLN